MLRDLASTARLPNLPTVWSNALTGHAVGLGLSSAILAGTPVAPTLRGGLLVALVAAASGLYLLGTFLNDAADAAFDAQHRSERPIPSGRLARGTVLNLGLSAGALGMLAALLLGRYSLVCAGLLVLCVLAYTLVHKRTAAGIVPMALCRALLYPMGGLAGLVAIGADLRPVVWWSLALGACQGVYIAGLSIAARTESLGPARPVVRGAALTLMSLPFLVPTGFVLWSIGRDGVPVAIGAGHLAWAFSTSAGLAWVWFASAGFSHSTARFVGRALPGAALVDLLPMAWLGSAGPAGMAVPLGAFVLALLLRRRFAAT